MMYQMIPLVESFLPLWHSYLVYFFALAFVAWVGAFIHYLLRR